MNVSEFKEKLIALLKKNVEINASLRPLLKKIIAVDIATHKMSKPGKFSISVGKTNFGETAYQRAIINYEDTFTLENIGKVKWLDIELPVKFGPSPRRDPLDIIGTSGKRLIFCELKYDNKAIIPQSESKTTKDSPLYALYELLIYHALVLENAVELQNHKIWHKNKKNEWDWTKSKNSDELLLIVAANETYWTRWQQDQNWSIIKSEIATIKKELPDSPTIKFYTLPEPEVPFTDQALGSEGERYIPTLGKNVPIVWKEITELK